MLNSTFAPTKNRGYATTHSLILGAVARHSHVLLWCMAYIMNMVLSLLLNLEGQKAELLACSILREGEVEALYLGGTLTATILNRYCYTHQVASLLGDVGT